MVDKYLNISDKESVSTAQALFIERDIDEGVFGDIVWHINDSVPNIKYIDKPISISVLNRNTNVILILCTMPYSVYESLIKEKVQKEIDYYLNFM